MKQLQSQANRSRLTRQMTKHLPWRPSGGAPTEDKAPADIRRATWAPGSALEDLTGDRDKIPLVRFRMGDEWLRSVVNYLFLVVVWNVLFSTGYVGFREILEDPHVPEELELFLTIDVGFVEVWEGGGRGGRGWFLVVMHIMIWCWFLRGQVMELFLPIDVGGLLRGGFGRDLYFAGKNLVGTYDDQLPKLILVLPGHPRNLVFLSSQVILEISTFFLSVVLFLFVSRVSFREGKEFERGGSLGCLYF